MKKNTVISILSCIVLICLVWFLVEKPLEALKEETGGNSQTEVNNGIEQNGEGLFFGGAGDSQSGMKVLNEEKVLSAEDLTALVGKELPVFRQEFYYDTTGIQGELTEEHIENVDQSLKTFLKKAGVELPEKLEPNEHSLQNGLVVYSYEGNTFVGKPSGISCMIKINRTNLTEKEMLEVIEKLPYVTVAMEEFGIENPVIAVQKTVADDGTIQSVSFKLYEEGDTVEEQIVNATFRYVKVEWASMDSGNIIFSYYPDALVEEVPTSAVKSFNDAVMESARSKEVGFVMPALSGVKVEYRTNGHPQYFVPYYVWEEGANTYSVPAVEWKIQ